jgi:hypothetical protein
MNEPSSVAQEAADIILSRDAAGQGKYGMSMDRGDLSPLQWIQHAIEEHADAIQYLIKLRREIKEKMHCAYMAGMNAKGAGDLSIDTQDRVVLALIEGR